MHSQDPLKKFSLVTVVIVGQRQGSESWSPSVELETNLENIVKTSHFTEKELRPEEAGDWLKPCSCYWQLFVQNPGVVTQSRFFPPQ